MPTANEYLMEEFIPRYWRKNNTVIPKILESRYRPIPANVELKEIFCMKEFRQVKRDHTLSWNSTIYQIKSPLNYSIYKGSSRFEVDK
jgi:hypothetical protein